MPDWVLTGVGKLERRHLLTVDGALFGLSRSCAETIAVCTRTITMRTTRIILHMLYFFVDVVLVLDDFFEEVELDFTLVTAGEAAAEVFVVSVES